MNLQSMRMLFLKDLFLSRRALFAYFVGGFVCSILMCIPNQTVAFVGLILVFTVAIASGIHLIGDLLLGENTEHTKSFVLSLPVSLLDYSLAKVAVVLATFLIPWIAMLTCSSVLSIVLPWAKDGFVAVNLVIFLELLAAFTIQLVTAVISESIGWTIGVMVGCNVFLNIFMMKLFANEEISAAAKSDVLTWPPILVQLIGVELVISLVAIVVSVLVQTRKRDLV
jgi:ABC-2 type transport system permease protein